MRTENGCSKHMPRAHASSRCSNRNRPNANRICTDGRTDGLTKTLSHLPYKSSRKSTRAKKSGMHSMCEAATATRRRVTR